MTDELDRIRSLRDAAPSPSDDWVHQTRAELLAMAAEEEQRLETDTEAGPLTRLRQLLAWLTSNPRPVALAGAAMLAVVVGAVGVALMAPGRDEPVAPLADATGAATPSPTPPSQSSSSAPQPPEPEDQGGVVLASSCEGGDGLYTIGYPEGWHTNSGEVSDPCQRFDEEPVELEPQVGGAPEQPVVVRVLPVGLDTASDPGEAQRETSRTEATVAQRPALVVEWTSTGDAATPEGLRSYHYLVDLGDGRTLMVAAYDLGGGSFDEHRAVVDAMVGSLELAQG